MKTPSIRQVLSVVCIPVVSFLLIFSFLSLKAQEWQAVEELVYVPGEMCQEPSIAVFNNYVYVVWEDMRDGLSAQAYLRRSDNYGEGFQPGIRLSADDNIEVSEPEVACWDDQAHVVWMGEDASSDNQVYYCRSQDGGVNFSTPVQITSLASESFMPVIAVYEQNVHIAWVDLKDMPSAIRVYYMRSVDGGATWSPEMPLGEMLKEGYLPRIAVDGQNVYLSWINLNAPPSAEIYFMISSNNGENWGPISSIYFTGNAVAIPNHCLCITGGQVNTIWEDFRNGSTFQIYCGRSPDGGNNFEPESCLNTDNAQYMHPAMASSAEFLHACWYNASNQIEYRKSNNMGDYWEPAVVISEPAINSYSPDLAAFNDNVYAVWEQSNSSGKLSIAFRRTTSDFSVDEISSVDKSRPVLFQNQPNPCRDITNFRFYLPHPSAASICIYNSAGRLIEKLGTGSFGSGEHKMEWSTDGYEAGIYYYQLLLDNDYGTVPLKKMIIL